MSAPLVQLRLESAIRNVVAAQEHLRVALCDAIGAGPAKHLAIEYGIPDVSILDWRKGKRKPTVKASRKVLDTLVKKRMGV